MARDEEIQFGKKRPAPADPDAQPLAKRFGRLRIGEDLQKDLEKLFRFFQGVLMGREVDLFFILR